MALRLFHSGNTGAQNEWKSRWFRRNQHFHTSARTSQEDRRQVRVEKIKPTPKKR
ncbi:hypothetical protein [Mesorhizobium sp. Root695]|uniref:hypothetical protein n=1 Tax=Mesorhizobium sp. Root695 TaxID=1736589 RepID=UPI000A93124C|nr:hypothetical protein [Mesorhizobium sp. Root695]